MEKDPDFSGLKLRPHQLAKLATYPDGKRHDYAKPFQGYSVTHWDGNSLVTERKSNDGTYHQTVKLTMQANGKEAVETVTSHTASGDNRAKLYWRRE